MAAARALENLACSGEGARFEQELKRNPYNLKTWYAYLAALKESSFGERRLVYERALRLVPRSYKLWARYLEELSGATRARFVSSGRATILARTYERALVHLHKMPRIWLDYTALLRSQRLGTATRSAFDRALRALPITQHEHIWPEYVAWAKEFGVAATCVVLYKRYVMFEPNRREQFVEYLSKIGRHGDAAAELAVCVNDEDFVSLSGKSKHQLWMRLCDMCALHPESLPSSLDVDAIIRSGLSRFTDEVGRLWCKLADYYIRLGRFERARDVYEEACTTVVTVRDFSMVFDAYAQFEESVLTAKMQMLEEEEASGCAEEDKSDDDEDSPLKEGVDENVDVELRLARLERLMARRPLLLSSVLLRQNPHAVAEWHARAQLVSEDPLQAIECYSDAVKTVDPQQAAGKPHTLWIAFAAYYEERGDLPNARVIADTATRAPLRSIDDLAAVYCWWAEMELRHENHDEALQVMQRAVLEPPASTRRAATLAKGQEHQKGEGGRPVSERVHRSSRLWSLYLDLEESLGTLESSRAAYDRCIELRVASPQTILNYAALLEEHEYWEDSFRCYERGVSLFKWPHVRELWLAYLRSFVLRYGGDKLERARDMFEQALKNAPAKDAAQLFVEYAKLEENHGLARRAMAIYERAASEADEERQFDAYRLYIAKIELSYGATKARPVYERAIGKLTRDTDCKRMCLAFADLERKLGEVDRARAVLAHGSQFANPRADESYWQNWREFEVQHGNEETFRDMLRVKRSVETAHSVTNYVSDEMLHKDVPLLSDAQALAQSRKDGRGAVDPSNGATRKRGADEGGADETQIEALERQAKRIIQATHDAASASEKQPAAADPNEISLDDDEEEDEAEKALTMEVELESRPVPAAVFGNVPQGTLDQGAPLGALARFKTTQ